MKLFIVLCLLIVSCSKTTDYIFPNTSDKEDKDEGKDTNDVTTDNFFSWTDVKEIKIIEAEISALSGGVKTQTSVSGYSGNGYLNGFWSKDATATFTVNVPEYALYQVKLRYLCNGSSSQFIKVNNDYPCHLSLPASNTFAEISLGNYPLNKGDNTITYQGDWGDVFVDKFVISTVPVKKYNIDATPVGKVSESTLRLYNYLKDNFGRKVIAGFLDGALVDGVDKQPLLYSWDFMSFTDGYAYKWDSTNGKHMFGKVDNGDVDKAIAWHKDKGSIVSFQWHWHAPADSEPGGNIFYTDQTNFDVTKAVTEGTKEYELVIRDIDEIAVQIKKMADNDVPVLFRPLHEAGGGWFWWGAKGPQACLKLYDIIFERMTTLHQLDNILWVWSTPEKDWYPGNDKVDVMGYDSYPGDYNYSPQYFAHNALFELTQGKKIISLTENGPIPDIDLCLKYDAHWAYFVPWSTLLYSQNSSEHIKSVYSNNNVITASK